ncbi:MAG: DUF1592 domain-containing protein [Phycisphaerales bacterium]
MTRWPLTLAWVGMAVALPLAAMAIASVSRAMEDRDPATDADSGGSEHLRPLAYAGISGPDRFAWEARIAWRAQKDERPEGAPPVGALADFVDAWCIDCHAGDRPKGDLDLRAAMAPGEPDPTLLIAIRKRLVDRDMPPREPRPDESSYAGAVGVVDAMLSAARRAGRLHEARPGWSAGGTGERNPMSPRRLSRAEYANTVRDLVGVGVDAETMLPADEIADGFDNQAGLTIAPLLVEKYMDAAETIAAEAVADLDEPPPVEVRRGAETMRGVGGARRDGKRWAIYSEGGVVADFDAPRRGQYLVSAEVAGQQAGPEPVRMALRRATTELRTFEIHGNRTVQRIEVRAALEEGRHTLGVAFLNDYYKPDDPDPAQRDRNAFVVSLALRGPLDHAVPTAVQRDLAARTAALPEAERLRGQAAILASRAWRRPVADPEVDELLHVADAAAGTDAGPSRRLRALVATLLVSPRFLLRAEQLDGALAVGATDRRDAPDAPIGASADGEADAGKHLGPSPNLAPWRLASSMSYFLWSTMPDETLFAAAADGSLDTPDGRRRQVRRMLDDARSLALAEDFATQWLQIRSLAMRAPDRLRFPGVDASLVEAMRDETVLFFDAVVRERRPVWDLLRADDTFLNQALAEHYGVPGIHGPQLRRVSLGALRGPSRRPPSTGVPSDLGILRHASILLATSNPTRTSPVKRGKWVLEAILDDPPAPPPPGVPALPGDGAHRPDESLRAMLERHRAEPGCAACHRRMDALGFALEPFDAVGRLRSDDDGAPIDSSAELPDGRRVDGPRGLRDVLVQGDAFLRSLARHMLVYARGRGVDERDDETVAELVAALREEPTIERLAVEIVERELARGTMYP